MSEKTKKIAMVGVLGAIATVLMLFEIALPFAPSFYKLDFSELPVLVGCFTMGPVAGVLIEAIKIALNFVINGTTTAGVGELANFLIGCSFCVPAGLIYKRNSTRKSALLGMAAGTGVMTIVGSAVNAFVLIPAYTVLMNIPMDAIIGMGTAVNPSITSVSTLVLFAVVPFNLLKGVLVSAIVFAVYGKLNPVLKLRKV